jgi:acetyltransferase-like isoleucine patch superfamily enzyme
MKQWLKSWYYVIKDIILWPNLKLRHSSVHITSRLYGKVRLNSTNIGAYCSVGPNSILNGVQIGNYCSIAPGVQIGGMEHSWWWWSMSTVLSRYCRYDQQTILEHDVWVGANAVIRQGVKIGCGAVVGALSMVTRDVEPYSMVVGVPAKLFLRRFGPELVNRLVATEYWKLPPDEAIRLLNGVSNSDPPSSKS